MLLVFQKDVGKALTQSSDFSDALIIAKAAKILRTCMLQQNFMAHFHWVVCKMLYLPFCFGLWGWLNIELTSSRLRFGVSKSDQATAQLIQFNCYFQYEEGAATHQHSKDRKTPFSVYMGLLVYAKTRKRNLVEMLHEHGLSIYDRVLEV